MLVDEWVATSRVGAAHPESVWCGNESSPYARDERIRRARESLEAVERSQKFVASPLCMTTANDLGRDRAAVDRTASYLFLPAALTWLDMTSEAPAGGIAGGRHAMLLVGEGKGIQRGEWMLVCYLRRMPGGDEGAGFMHVSGRFDLSRGGALTPLFPEQMRLFTAAGGDVQRLGATVLSLLALINTPRLAHVREADLGQINAARSKRRHPPILQYKEVAIRVDSGALGNGFQKQQTDGKALHHVRAFLRLRMGKVQLVRPHWRGNPRFGVVVHRYVVVRTEDEAGPWKGGPLPPPTVIRELDDGNNS